MKRLFSLFSVATLVLFTVTSCSFNDEPVENFYFEGLEITDVEMPETFKLGDAYRIKVTMTRPTSCHYFEGFDFSKTGETERTVVGVASVFNENTCEVLEENSFENYFDFEVIYTSTYTFKFWAGEDENGENEYLIIDVPVEE